MDNQFVVASEQPLNSQELSPKLNQINPEHPALSRMRAKMMQSSGIQAITAYDRMHHRHNRS